MANEACLICKSTSGTVRVVEEFAQRGCGHVYCRKCGISYDSNIDEISTKGMSEGDVEPIASEEKYRELFVETSEISTDDVIYPKFKWDDESKLRKGVANHVVNSIKSNTSTQSNMKILDVGCGNGFTSLELADEFPDANISSLDPSPQVLSINGYEGRVQARQGILTSTSYADNTFDVVVIVGNLMLHDDPSLTLINAHKFLKPGGLLIIDYKNIKSSVRQFCILLARLNLSKYLPKNLFDRNFVNMRYGFHDKYFIDLLSSQNMSLVKRLSKPPRLLEFSNKSNYTSGWKGIIWRMFDAIDKVNKQQAWIQLVFKKS